MRPEPEALGPAKPKQSCRLLRGGGGGFAKRGPDTCSLGKDDLWDGPAKQVLPVRRQGEGPPGTPPTASWVATEMTTPSRHPGCVCCVTR